MKKCNLVLVLVLLVCCTALFSGCANEQKMYVRLDYGFHRPGLATPLIDGCKTEFLDKDAWGLDVFLPGDVYVLTYHGEIMVLETYPGTVILPEGGLLDVTRIDAGILCLVYDGGWKPAEDGYILSGELCEYVVLDEQGNFCTLAEYDISKPLYVTYEQAKALQTENGSIAVTPLAAYAYLPRN